MAAPVNPTSAQLSRGFYQLAIDIVTICSNMSLPSETDATVTTAISGATATALVNILAKQRDLY